MICDRLVLGIANENSSRRLLRELELTLSQTGRSDGKRVKAIDNTISDSVNVAQARQKRKDGEMNNEQTFRTVCCKYCGGGHKNGSVPHMERRVDHVVC